MTCRRGWSMLKVAKDMAGLDDRWLHDDRSRFAGQFAQATLRRGAASDMIAP
jgi:hypothetical protein